MNQQNYPDQPHHSDGSHEQSWRDNPQQKPRHYQAQDRGSHAGAPPPPPPGPPHTAGPGGDITRPYGPYGPYQPDNDPHQARPHTDYQGPTTDPRNDPRWVHSPHDSRDESREIPYFNGQQAPQPRPRRRGPLHGFIIGAGILGFAILLLGLLSQIFDWDSQSNPVQDFFAPSQEAPSAVPEGDASVDNLVADLDHAHDGIAVDWEAGGEHTGPGLDPGQEVGSAPGVFMVDTQVYQYLGFGTGMVVSSDGLAITNYHVVESSMSVNITMADTDQQYSATVLGRDADKDIAVLQIDTDETLQVASINPENINLEDRVAGVGNAGGQGYLTSVVGEVGGIDETIHIEPQEPGSQAQWLSGLIMITSDIVPGYSGGPTVDTNGQVIGISTAASQDTTNTEASFGYAVPIVNALEVVEQVVSGDDSGSVVIGAGGALGIVVATEEDGGARIMEVAPGSAGDAIGLQPDDVILEIDGQEVVNSSFISRYVRDMNPGEQVDVVWRTVDGDLRQETAALDEAEIN